MANLRTGDYKGFNHATGSANDVGSGLMLWSGSMVLNKVGAYTSYSGIGLELIQNSDSYFRFATSTSTQPGELDIRAQQFFVGTETSQFVSGSGNNIEISSSNFHLKPDGGLIVGSNAVINGNLSANSIFTPANTNTSTARAYIDQNGVAKFAGDGAGEYKAVFNSDGSATIAGFTIDSSEIKSSNNFLRLKSNGQITASAGEIAGFTIDSSEIKSSNDNLRLKSNGHITGSLVNFDGGNIGGFTLSSTALTGGTAGTTVALTPGTGIHMGAAAFISAPFSVNNEGVIKAESGTIGGWSLGANELTGGKMIIRNDGTIESSGFASDVPGSGFRLTAEDGGFLEVENARIRGTISTAVFEKETVNAVGGQLYVANSSTLTGSGQLGGDVADAGIHRNTDTTMSVANVSGFATGEILTLKKFTNTGFSTEYVYVNSSSRVDSSSETDLSGKLYVQRGYTNIVNTDTQGFITDGHITSSNHFITSTSQSYSGSQTIVSTGKWDEENGTGTGYIRLNANPNDQFTPYIDIVERTGSGIYDLDLKARLGDLSGLSSDRLHGEDPSGQYGLYSKNVFLEGGIVANTGSIAGIKMRSGKLFTGTGTHGDLSTGFYVDDSGNFSLADKFIWNGSTLTLKGAVRQTSGGETIADYVDRGSWTSGTNYIVNDLVQYSSNNTTSTYKCIAQHTATDNTNTGTGRPDTANSTAWEIFAQGSQGQDGDDGLNTAPIFAYKRATSTPGNKPSITRTYTFADGTFNNNDLGNSWSGVIPAGTDDLYVCTAVASSDSATDNVVSADWSSAQLLSSTGEDGAAGADGAGIVYRGEWASGISYTGTSTRKDVVKGSDNQYYIAKSTYTSDGNSNPVGGSNASTYWESFGASFTSVATDILFSSQVYADQTINIGSQGSTPVIALNADSGNSNANPYIGINASSYDTSGIFIGYDNVTPKLSLKSGTGANYLKWDGSNLSIAGQITLTDGSDIENGLPTSLTNLSRQSHALLKVYDEFEFGGPSGSSVTSAKLVPEGQVTGSEWYVSASSWNYYSHETINGVLVMSSSDANTNNFYPQLTPHFLMSSQSYKRSDGVMLVCDFKLTGADSQQDFAIGFGKDSVDVSDNYQIGIGTSMVQASTVYSHAFRLSGGSVITVMENGYEDWANRRPNPSGVNGNIEGNKDYRVTIRPFKEQGALYSLYEFPDINTPIWSTSSHEASWTNNEEVLDITVGTRGTNTHNVYHIDDISIIGTPAVDLLQGNIDYATNKVEKIESQVVLDASGLTLRDASFNDKVEVEAGGVTIYGDDANTKSVMASNGLTITKDNTTVAEMLGTGVKMYGGDATNHTLMNSSGLTITQNNQTAATFTGAAAKLFGGATTTYAEVTSTGLELVKGGTTVANFSDITTIGEASHTNTYLELSDQGIQIKSSGKVKFEVSASGETSMTGNLKAQTVSSTIVRSDHGVGSGVIWPPNKVFVHGEVTQNIPWLSNSEQPIEFTDIYLNGETNDGDIQFIGDTIIINCNAYSDLSRAVDVHALGFNQGQKAQAAGEWVYDANRVTRRMGAIRAIYLPSNLRTDAISNIKIQVMPGKRVDFLSLMSVEYGLASSFAHAHASVAAGKKGQHPQEFVDNAMVHQGDEAQGNYGGGNHYWKYRAFNFKTVSGGLYNFTRLSPDQAHPEEFYSNIAEPDRPDFPGAPYTDDFAILQYTGGSTNPFGDISTGPTHLEGDVLIGPSSGAPIGELRVKGALITSGELTAHSTITCHSTIRCKGSFTSHDSSISDINLKDNISVIQQPLSKIMQISGNSYTWNGGMELCDSGSKSVGVIAQEVEKVLPTAVREYDGYKSVEYNQIVALLVECVKEQQHQIADLRSQIEDKDR